MDGRELRSCSNVTSTRSGHAGKAAQRAQDAAERAFRWVGCERILTPPAVQEWSRRPSFSFLKTGPALAGLFAGQNRLAAAADQNGPGWLRSLWGLPCVPIPGP